MPTYHSALAQSNKFWSYTIKNDTEVEVSWGRVGASGQSKIHSFGSKYERDAFINDKISEKTSGKKGYKLITEEKKQEELETARDLGTQYKINRIEWVSKKGNTLQVLQNYDPGRYVYVEILDSWKKDVVRLILNKTETFEVDGISEMKLERLIECNGLRPTGSGGFADAVRRYLKRLATQVKEVILTLSFAAVGARKLDLGDGDTSDISCSSPDVLKLVGENSSGQVVSKFFALGKRVLDI